MQLKGNRIAIKQDLPTQKEKACVLAEELGHFYTSTGNILEFLKEALDCYRSKYGVAVKFNNYIIGFEPTLYVLELSE